MTVAPRLLTLGDARKYLSGEEPADLGIQPLRLKVGLRYDRAVLDQKLDAMSGIGVSSQPDGPEADLQRWIASHGAP
jgi:hypothetical protein